MAKTPKHRKRRRRCDECGKLKRDVELRVDPYEEEINNIEILVWLCDECYDERLMEI